jgi:hypothetical protein
MPSSSSAPRWHSGPRLRASEGPGDRSQRTDSTTSQIRVASVELPHVTGLTLAVVDEEGNAQTIGSLDEFADDRRPDRDWPAPRRQPRGGGGEGGGGEDADRKGAKKAAAGGERGRRPQRRRRRRRRAVSAG